MLDLVGKVDGTKSYLLGAALIAVGFAEMFGLDLVPEIDGSNAWSSVTTGLGIIAARSAMKKREGEK